VGDTTGAKAHIDYITMPLGIVGSSVEDELSDLMDITLSNQFDAHSNYLHRFPDNDGLMGIGYGDYGASAISFFKSGRAPTLGLNFLGPGMGQSRIDLYGIDERYREHLTFGSPDVRRQGLHQFKLETLSVCGVDMLEDYNMKGGRVGWNAIVDTGASCLGLPGDFFDMLVTWLPVECDNIIFSTDGEYYPQTGGCSLPYLNEGVNETDLPTLTFTITPGGPKLYLPLADLVIDPSLLSHHRGQPPTLRRQLCITRFMPIEDAYRTGTLDYLFVSFGTRAIRSLYTVFYMEGHRVGMANKEHNRAPSNAQCAPRKVCAGMQSAYKQYNVCLNPPCEDYYMFVFDDETKSCKLSDGFHLLSVFLLLLFISMEIGLDWCWPS